MYCKSGNFRENFIFANSVKRHICDAKNLRLGHDLPISVNDRVISPFREDFIFTKLAKFRKNKTLAKISEFTVAIFNAHPGIDPGPLVPKSDTLTRKNNVVRSTDRLNMIIAVDLDVKPQTIQKRTQIHMKLGRMYKVIGYEC